VKRYDPDKNADPGDWLATTERTRQDLVESYHRQAGERAPSEHVHAAIHVIVENQLALPEVVVVDTLRRLQREGLTRHEAIHAIGSVLAEQLYELLRQPPQPTHADPTVAYRDKLKQLTAAAWRRSGIA
jgi:hypothetical protein